MRLKPCIVFGLFPFAFIVFISSPVLAHNNIDSSTYDVQNRHEHEETRPESNLVDEATKVPHDGELEAEVIDDRSQDGGYGGGSQGGGGGGGGQGGKGGGGGYGGGGQGGKGGSSGGHGGQGGKGGGGSQGGGGKEGGGGGHGKGGLGRKGGGGQGGSGGGQGGKGGSSGGGGRGGKGGGGSGGSVIGFHDLSDVNGIKTMENPNQISKDCGKLGCCHWYISHCAGCCSPPDEAQNFDHQSQPQG